MIRVGSVLIALSLVAMACSGNDGSTGEPSSNSAGGGSTVAAQADCRGGEEGCTLRQAADAAGVYFGAAVTPELLSEPAYRQTLAREFNSLTPENHLKWPLVHPAPDVWDFEAADQLVAFAEENAMAVKGHTLIWGQDVGNGIPDWVRDIDDPDELQAVLDDHIATLVGRYAGRVDRWDVVNEPLLTLGASLDPNHFHEVLGPGYIGDAFEAARRADPEARLFLNENSVEAVPAKADALLELVEGLVAEGVPIDGVGLQAHQLTGVPPAPGVLEGLVSQFRAMGLEVAVTELDVPLTAGTDVQTQADAYSQIVGECLAAGCNEITVWGVYDGSTWLDAFLDRDNTAPLLFDDEFNAKPAYQAVVDELLAVAP